MQLLNRLLPSVDNSIFGWCQIGDRYSKNILTSSEKTAWTAFRNADRRREYLATRGLLWEMVEQMDLDPTLFTLKKDTLGKPYGQYNTQTYYISIAHTKKHILCGISSDLAIGVDLEPCDRCVTPKLRKRIVNASEKRLLKKEPILRIWTIKEALVKLQGKGMRTNLNDCTVVSRNNNLFAARFYNDKSAKICSFRYENHWLAFAWND